MKSMKRNQKKKMDYLFCQDELINFGRKGKANSEDKEGQVVILSPLLDPRRLEMTNTPCALSARSVTPR